MVDRTASAFPSKCDTSDWDHQVAMFKHARATYGHIDVVVPNAGIGETGEWLKDAENESGDPVVRLFHTVGDNGRTDDENRNLASPRSM
jgi:NAD(P)-dependent dehydrogenase (short-subunit alcohol dehydrogenase family)